jgi:hypothetical protein
VKNHHTDIVFLLYIMYKLADITDEYLKLFHTSILDTWFYLKAITVRNENNLFSSISTQ